MVHSSIVLRVVYQQRRVIMMRDEIFSHDELFKLVYWSINMQTPKFEMDSSLKNSVTRMRREIANWEEIKSRVTLKKAMYGISDWKEEGLEGFTISRDCLYFLTKLSLRLDQSDQPKVSPFRAAQILSQF